MAQKLIMLEALPNEDILASAPLASLINAGYEVKSVDGFYSKDNKPMSLVLLSEKPEEGVATPILTPASGEDGTSIEVTISCETEGAGIVYTLDGSDPDGDLSEDYEEPITITESCTLIAQAYVFDGDVRKDSGYAVGFYTIGD